MNIIYLPWIILSMVLLKQVSGDRILFDGKSFDHWQVIEFEGHGDVSVADSSLIIGKGELISGIRWNGDFPKTDYEVSLLAKRVDGHDFFCAITFPVKDSFLTLVLGGWGGAMCGLSCIDGYDAANNYTGTIFYFGTGTWWPVRLRVTNEKVEAWTGPDKLVDFTIGSSKLSLRWEMESSVPFGITTYKTTGAIKDIRLHMLSE
jgi:hypothetical protein